MRRGLSLAFAALIAFGLSARTPVLGQTGSSGSPAVLEQWILSTPERAAFIAAVTAQLRRHDVAQDGLDAQDIETMELARAAEERAHRVRQLLLYDINGDGNVTRKEAMRVIRGKYTPRGSAAPTPASEKRIEIKVDEVMKADLNGDDTIAPDEMRAHDPEKGKRRDTRNIDILKSLLALDPNKDGRLTIEELTSIAEETFRRYDTNGSGLITDTEMEAARSTHDSERQRRQAREVCDLPAPAPIEQIAVLGIYQGKSLSTVTVVGMDGATTTGTVVVEPGHTPLYLIVTSHEPMIWQFKGATERITRLIAIPQRAKDGPGVGVVGVDRKKVSFIKPGSCHGDFYEVTSAQAQKARSTFEQVLGRPAETFAGLYGLETVNLPSAEAFQAPRLSHRTPTSAETAMFQELMRFYPGGLTELDPADVFAPGAVKRYDVLPQQAGLLQLIRANALVPSGNGRFRIVKPIARFPAGLYGGHSVNFLLAKGVPMPGGSYGHGCVHSDEDGRILAGSMLCRPLNSSTGSAAAKKGPAKGLHPVLEQTLLSAKSHSQYMRVVLNIFREYDPDQNGLDAKDIEAFEASGQVNIRADRMKVALAHDLDGDGRVTRDEVEQRTRRHMGLPLKGPVGPREAQSLSQRVAKIMAPDANHDGILTYDELRLPQEGDRKNTRNKRAIHAQSLLDADPNKDGRLTVEELTKLAEETFRRYDGDGDNLLTKEEINALLREAQNPR